MLIRALMLPREGLVTVTPEDNLETALERIDNEGFLSIPVAEGTRFEGIISKEMIFSKFFEGDYDSKEEYLENTKVREVVRTDIPNLSPWDTIEKAAHTLEVYGVQFVAVISDTGEFEGIMTHHTIFREFADLLGINKGRRLSIIAYDVKGQVAKLTDVIAKNNADIISFVIMDPKVKTDVREFVIRVRTDNYPLLVEKIKKAGFLVQ